MSSLLVTIYFSAMMYTYIVLPSYAFRSRYTYIKTLNGHYKYHEQEASWIDAVSICKAEGGQLFYPENETEVAQLIMLLKDFNIDPNYIHIGISNLRTNSVYETVDGRPISEVYNKWYPGYPIANRHCVVLYVYDYHTFYNDYCETYHTKYICTLKQNETIGMTSTSTVAPEIKPLSLIQKYIEEVTMTFANAIDRQTASLDRQGVAIAGALDKQTDAMQRQALALENLAHAFSSYTPALHNLDPLTAPNLTVIMKPDTDSCDGNDCETN